MARDYGITNAAPYASAPTVGLSGDTYWNTTQKILYLSDGSTWVVPAIPASTVRGTPSSGGTAREIAKASIWGGDDLIDASITKAKLGADVSRLVVSDLTAPSVGQNSSGFVLSLDFSATALVTNRMYRLHCFGSFSKAVACDLYMSINVVNVNVFLGLLSPTATASETAYYILEMLLLYTGTQVSIASKVDISGAVAGGATGATVARGVMKTGVFAGSGSAAPAVYFQFTAANASNSASRYQATLEVL